MELISLVAGRGTMYILVGYIVGLVALVLGTSAATSFYQDMVSAARSAPVSALVVSAPAILFAGAFVDTVRVVLRKVLLKRSDYAFAALQPGLASSLRECVGSVLGTQLAEDATPTDAQFAQARAVLAPERDEFDITSRWLHDLFENTAAVSVVALLIIGFRALHHSYGALEWLTIAGSASVVLLYLAASGMLRTEFTVREVGAVIAGTRKS